MITIKNLLKDSTIRQGSQNVGDITNLYNVGPISVTAGNYYLIPFSLLVSSPVLPRLISVTASDSTVLTQVAAVTLSTVVQITAYQKVNKSLGFYLYGGYCTESNPAWSATAYFGANYFSAFACAIDEVQGATSAPIGQFITELDNVGSLTPGAGNVSYLVGTSLTPNGIYPINLGSDWTTLATGYAENVIPNLITGYSSTSSTPGWTETITIDAADKGLIACELIAS